MPPIKIAIQGIKGSFHEEAAKKLFPAQSSILACESFESSCNALQRGLADYTLMAVENSEIGPFLSNYELIDRYRLKSIDEISLPIRLHLLGKTYREISDVKAIRSHRLAFRQCEAFLSTLKDTGIIPVQDTATAALQVSSVFPNDAAIAGPLCAELFKLKVIAEDLQGEKINYTKFLLLENL